MFLKNDYMKKIKSNISNYLFLLIYLIGVFSFFLFIFLFEYHPFASNSSFFKPTVNYDMGIDFDYFYFAGMRAAEGKNFYFPIGDHYGHIGFIYPPLMAYVFVPFSYMPRDVSFFVYSLFSILLLFLSVLILSKFVKQKLIYFFITFLLFFFSPFFLLHLDRGQTNIEVVFLISLCLWFFYKQKYKLTGALLASAVMFKLMPVLFAPYFFIKNKKIFYSTIFFGLVSVLLFGLDTISNFLVAVFNFASNVIIAGGWNTGLGGMIYNRFTYTLLSFSEAKVILVFLGLLISAVFYYIFYRVNSKTKNVDFDINLVLLEFGTLMFLVSFLPSVSWLHNGLYYIFIFTAYWNLRVKIPRIYDFLIQALFFLSFSQPLLLPLFDEQPFMTIFALRPGYMLLIVVLMWYFYFKITSVKNLLNNL